jgi:VanZ family protein
MRKFLYNWWPVIIWVALIAMESTDLMSGAHTGKLLDVVLTPIFGVIENHRLELINFLLRKIGHLTGYAILSLLVFRALRRSYANRSQSFRVDSSTLRRWAAQAIAFTALVASADEFHQSFIPSRTSSIGDVMLDTFGAVLMMIFVLLTCRLQQRRELA